MTAVHHTGKICCEEFVKSLLKFGYEERQRSVLAERELQAMREAEREKRRQQILEEQSKKNALQVEYSYSEQDFHSAIFKLTEAAWR